MDADTTRQEVHDFFDRNYIEIAHHGFYDSEFIRGQIAILDYLGEADETLKKMDGAKTAGGTWELPFEFESEQGEDAVADGDKNENADDNSIED